MNTVWQTIQQQWTSLIAPVTIFVVIVILGFAIRSHLFATLDRWAAKSKGHFDDALIAALRGPFMLWVLILAVHLATESSPLSQRHTAVIAKVLVSLWIISLTVVASKLSGALIRLYSAHIPAAMQVTTLTQNLASVFAVILGALILLNTLGISITPILTALGVGGLAVALALQDTLSNLFAGFYVSVAGQVRVGDYIKLDTGHEGYVTDISWRSTTIRALANNLIVVPNAKLAQAIVTNFYLPEKRMGTSIKVSVSYDNDPDEIQRILTEEAVAAAETIPGLLKDPAPSVQFNPGFGDSSIDFSVNCQVAEFVNQYGVQHELRKRVFARLRKEGIEIPFPTRTVYMRGVERNGGDSGERAEHLG
jgi:small-conductance mechanosensitive channel